MKNKTIKMLMVDTRSLTANLDRMGYREMGAVVSQASSAEETKQKLKAGMIDVVVLNYDDKEIDASGICRQIKGSQKKFGDVAVIATTVQADEGLRNRALSDGVDLVVEQPIPRQVFIEQIKQLLDQSTRENKRVIPDLPEAKVSVDGKTMSLAILDISKTGILLATDAELPLESSVTLEIRLSQTKRPISIAGVVVRNMSSGGRKGLPSGVGVRFQSFINSEGESLLQDFLTKASLEVDNLRYYT